MSIFNNFLNFIFWTLILVLTAENAVLLIKGIRGIVMMIGSSTFAISSIVWASLITFGLLVSLVGIIGISISLIKDIKENDNVHN